MDDADADKLRWCTMAGMEWTDLDRLTSRSFGEHPDDEAAVLDLASARAECAERRGMDE